MMTLTEHLLTILIEECNETAQRATKALRFGMKETQPEQDLNNEQRIIYEFNDIVATMEMLQGTGAFRNGKGVLLNIIDYKMIEAKKEKILKYIAYAGKCGTLSKDTEK